MSLLNRRKESPQSGYYDKCLDLLKLSTVPSNEVDLLMSQIKSIIEELKAINQPIDELEIVTEVLEQNDYEFINSQQAKLIEKSLKINKSGREIVLTDEAMTKLNIDVKLGGVIIDLRNYQFNGGNLLLNLKASYAGVEIYINEDVAISDWIENKYSGVAYEYNQIEYNNPRNLPSFETKHTITLEGKIKASGVTFRIGHEGDFVNHVTKQKDTKEQTTNLNLDENTNTNMYTSANGHLNTDYATEATKAQLKAAKKKIRNNQKISRKIERLQEKIK